MGSWESVLGGDSQICCRVIRMALDGNIKRMLIGSQKLESFASSLASGIMRDCIL